jgi:hypothetical protein
VASPEWTVGRHLEVGSEQGRDLWHRFADLVAACGEHSLSVAKTTVTFKGPKRGFAGARPKGDELQFTATTCDLCSSIVGPASWKHVSCVFACPHNAAFRVTGDELWHELESK